MFFKNGLICSVLAPKSGNYSNEPLTELPITILGLNSFDPEPL